MYARSEIVRDYSIEQIGMTKFIRVILNKNKVSIGIIGYYRLPSLNKDDFLLHLNGLLGNKIIKKLDVEIFLGDMNINILKTESMEVTQYLNILQRYGYCCLVDKPTRFREGQQSSCIDHVFVGNLNGSLGSQTRVLFSGLSDHCPILLNIELKQSKIAAQNKFIERINYENLSRSLGQENWNNIIDSKDVDHCAELIVSKIRNHIERAREKVYIKCKYRNLKPWITQGLIKSIM